MASHSSLLLQYHDGGGELKGNVNTGYSVSKTAQDLRMTILSSESTYICICVYIYIHTYTHIYLYICVCMFWDWQIIVERHKA